jgi:hypothetical protein
MGQWIEYPMPTDPFARKKRDLPAALKERNAEAAKARAKRNRQAGAALAREKKRAQEVEKGVVLPVADTRIQAEIQQRLSEIPDENPVKQMCAKLGHNPLEFLVKMAKSARDAKTKVELNKYLSDKLVPNLRAVDMQQKLKMNVTVRIQSFRGSETTKAPEPARTPFVDADYEEFEGDGDE